MQLKQTECVGDIKASLVTVMQRLQMDFLDIDQTANDIFEEFRFTTIIQIREALRKGSLGSYGRTYKLSTQEVCVWIRAYLKDNKPKLI